MRTRLILSMLLALGGWAFLTPSAEAACVVETTATYAEGTSLRDDHCLTDGSKKVTIMGGSTAGATLGVTLTTCISGESACNGTDGVSYLRTRGSVVLPNSLGSVTSATSSTVGTVPTGPKTFVAQIINATSETKAATVQIYGNIANSTTGGILICTITLPSTATTLQLQDACPVTSVNFSYYFFTATVYTSASAAPLTVYAAN